jgi:predicted NBD/HSP70 family sugar kinase
MNAPYRDDLEAALARIHDLERANAEQEEELRAFHEKDALYDSIAKDLVEKTQDHLEAVVAENKLLHQEVIRLGGVAPMSEQIRQVEKRARDTLDAVTADLNKARGRMLLLIAVLFSLAGAMQMFKLFLGS